MSETSSSSVPAERSYEDVLADAVQVLTEAARLTRPVLEPIEGADAGAAWVESGKRAPGDWAEFVTLALAGAAANVGGVETALRGRPGSWEADGVRTLLTSTVGHDEAYLLEHRTDPVLVTVYVDEILGDLGVGMAYYDAQGVIGARADQIPADAEDREQRWDVIAEDEERLERDRERAWAAYGDALRANVLAAAARRSGLRVPVQVTVDLDTFRPFDEREDAWLGLEAQMVQEAIEATPPPAVPPAPVGPTTGV